MVVLYLLSHSHYVEMKVVWELTLAVEFFFFFFIRQKSSKAIIISEIFFTAL